MKRIFAASILLLGICSQHTCSRTRHFPAYGNGETIKESFIQEGLWEFELSLGPENLPFYCEYKAQDSSFNIINATETIRCKPVVFKGDSIFFTTPFFDNIFKLRKISRKTILGIWCNTSKGPDYKIPVKASIADSKPSVNSKPVLTGDKWEVKFGNANAGYSKAIGVFNYFEPETETDVMTVAPITGTFMTESGDYRFLEGKKTNNSFTLSCFDGGHAFLFKAEFNASKDSIKGIFYSGNHYKEEWVAWHNPNARLTNPDSLTALRPGYESLSFSLPNLKGETVTFPSARFDNKVTIVEIMGSWCPNCMDQTQFMQQMKNKYQSKGLEIVALCFERSSDFNKSVASVSKMTSNLKADYEFLIAGTAQKNDALKILPMLTCICSYPTTIYIDKKGKVRKIYTGFYGPSTGSYYSNYTEQTENFIERLLKE